MPAIADPQEAETLAILTDLGQADLWLETAVHAGDRATAADAVSECAGWLSNAADTYMGQHDPDNAASCSAASAVVAGWTVPAAQPALGVWQATTAYPFHATIAGLIDNESARLSRAQGYGMVFMGVLGLIVLASVASGYIDYRQTHGGYRREAPGVATPLVAYRYPQSRAATRGRRRSG